MRQIRVEHDGNDYVIGIGTNGLSDFATVNGIAVYDYLSQLINGDKRFTEVRKAQRDIESGIRRLDLLLKEWGNYNE